MQLQLRIAYGFSNVERKFNLKTLPGSWVRLVLGISVTLNQFDSDIDSIHTQIFSFFRRLKVSHWELFIAAGALLRCAFMKCLMHSRRVKVVPVSIMTKAECRLNSRKLFCFVVVAASGTFDELMENIVPFSTSMDFAWWIATLFLSPFVLFVTYLDCLWVSENAVSNTKCVSNPWIYSGTGCRRMIMLIK